jgi:hypothetical protein
MGEDDHQLVLNFWNANIMISPVRNDVKHKCIRVGNWEEYLTHYLQKT